MAENENTLGGGWIFLIVICVLLALGSGAYFLYFKKPTRILSSSAGQFADGSPSKSQLHGLSTVDSSGQLTMAAVGSY